MDVIDWIYFSGASFTWGEIFKKIKITEWIMCYQFSSLKSEKCVYDRKSAIRWVPTFTYYSYCSCIRQRFALGFFLIKWSC